MQVVRRIFLASSGVLVAGMMMGASCAVPTPDPAAVLAGDWETTDDLGESVVVRFDDHGVVEAILVSTDAEETATILVEGASTTLEGSDVTIVVPTPGGDATFVGTLSEDENTMTGTVDRMIDVGDELVVIIPQGDMTLTRVPAAQDGDEDGVVDDVDNCPIDANAEQGDVDDDGVGDVCDNCPDDANADQSDVDADGQGDVCDDDVDTDGDGMADDIDNCVDVANDDQADSDADGVGDVCDNCPDDANPDQIDVDADGQGDVCDDIVDTDDDGVADDIDNCVDVANDDQADTDADGVGDVCDNCPDDANADQDDDDDDGIGDVCDAA